MSDTPKTDANCGWPVGHHGRIESSDMKLSPDGPFVHSSVARELECENAALRAAIAESEEFGRKNGETLAAKVSELLRENAALRDTVEQWKCRYYDVADAICRESNGIEDLCRQARALRADKSRLDWLDKNMTARDSFQTFEKEVLIGEIRKAIDAAMHRQEKQLWRRSYE